MSKISYTDKELASLFTHQDANEIKESVNAIYDVMESAPSLAGTLFRSKSAVAANGTSNQTITYTMALVNAGRPKLEDYQGLGLEVVSYSNTGFVLKSLTAGLFGYYTCAEI